jgi:teichuronic acid biosynthesis glycosyltransferase TuaG
MRPRVSIITPMFNAARWLPETLASVRAQTFADWEHLLVEDGSVDASAAIVEAAAREDGRIQLMRAPCHLGPSAARNLAIDVARGRYIAFLDADDLWLPEKLALSVEAMSANGFSFTYHDFRHISADGLEVGELVRGPEELNFHTLHTRRGTGCLTVVIDRERIPEVRFPRIGRRHGEDFCLWLSLIQNGHTGHRIPLDLARYRRSSNSRSGKKLRSALNAWWLYREFSKLPRAHAALWWTQYAWDAFRIYLRATPR